MFIIGLVLLAISSIIVAKTLWQSAKYFKWSGVPLAIGMTLYLPQFMAEQPFRVLHGILIAGGCLSIAWELNNQIKLNKRNV